MKNLVLLLVATLILSTIVIETSIGQASSQSTSEPSGLNPDAVNVSISLKTKNTRYLESEAVFVSGTLFDSTGKLTDGKVSVIVTRYEPQTQLEQPVFEAVTFAHGGVFNQSLKLDKAGKY